MECWVADEEKYYMTERGENVRVVGGAGQLKICASREGFPVTDCIVSGRESETELDGVPLKTGYFVSKPNSRGERTVIFFAEYTLDGMTVYTELSGDLSDKEQVGARLTETVGGMIMSGSPDKYAIKNE